MDSKDQKKGSGVGGFLGSSSSSAAQTLTCSQGEGEKQFSIQPIKDSGCADPKFAAIQANPGPAITQNMPAQEGSKEEREARKKALNE
ncbi:hypothetical protein E4U42_003250 [Claviceps africana]|uniref:Uncharacterized protein n=1 Tax=Claviceps africana TaxID=83212 RepID=A0A8K0JD53_9HYPO|nr:hypothetical protein E4U42_003250 [Claviceps africana]